jgi:mono/diheme cytochrome c family protein
MPSTGEDSGDSSSGGMAEPEHLATFHELCSPCHGHDGEGVEVPTDPSMDLGPEIRHPHPLIASYMVRAGDDNSTLNANGVLVGHPGEMDPFTTPEVTDEVLAEIVAWLQAFPREQTGAALFADHCGFCHGTAGGTDTEYVSAYHNMPFLTSGGTDTPAEFFAYVRAGHVVDDEGAAVLPSQRRAWMPPFDAELVTDSELALIESWARQQ